MASTGERVALGFAHLVSQLCALIVGAVFGGTALLLAVAVNAALGVVVCIGLVAAAIATTYRAGVNNDAGSREWRWPIQRTLIVGAGIGASFAVFGLLLIGAMGSSSCTDCD